MNIEYKCTYDEDETRVAVLAMHIAKFGNSPDGYHWECLSRYDGYSVKAVEDAIEKATVPNEG